MDKPNVNLTDSHYCENCKYYKRDKLIMDCTYEKSFNDIIVNEYNHVVKYENRRTLYGDLKWNVLGKCPKYIRKWWMFWIK